MVREREGAVAAAPPGSPVAEPTSRQRWVWALVGLVLVTLPFLAVTIVPSTDLPQHLGQLRLFGEALDDPGDRLTIQWWTPYGMVYALLAVPWLLLPPILAGRVGFWLIVALQIGAVHWLAAKQGRPIAGALLASTFIFHDQLYWGFLNFLFAFVVFAGWFVLTRRPEAAELAHPRRTAALFLVLSAALYFSHALWFACGLLWLALESLLSRRSWRNLAWRAAGVLPLVVVALYWFAFLRRSVIASPPVWILQPWERLRPVDFVLAALGALRHPIELLVIAAAVLWVVGALISRRREPWWGCDRYLLALAGLFFALYLLVPNQFSTTMRMSTRWAPFIFLALLLAVGRPRLRPGLRRALAVAVLGTLMVVSAAFWLGFEANELSGLEASLEALEEGSRVIGLSYLETSRFFRGRPFIQTFSWAYAAKGGVLNFSFADSPLSLVVHNDLRRQHWTRGLEWWPKAVRRSDFAHFDYALVGGDEQAHTTMRNTGVLRPVAGESPETEAVWRLYRVEAPAAAVPVRPDVSLDP